MAREFEIYNGVRVSAPDVRLQAPEVAPTSPMHGHELDAAIGGAMGAVEQYARLKDFGTQQELRRKRAESEAAMDAEWKEKAALAWGSEGSIFREDGSLNEDEFNSFVSKWQEEDAKNRASARFWTRDAAMKEDETSANVQQGLAIEGMKRALAAAQANRKQLFEDNYQLAVAKDDWDTACAVVDEAVAGGQITRPRGEYLKLRAGKARLRRVAGGGGSVRVGGEEFGGLAAALRAQQVRDGFRLDESPSEGVRQDGAQGDFTLGGMPEEVSLKGADGMETDVATPGVQGDFTLDAEGLRGAVAERGAGDEWMRFGDFSGVLGSLNQGEVDEVSSLWVQDGAIVKDERPDGSVSFAAGSATAPEAVERVAAVATAQGAVNAEAARAMVARMVMDAVTADPDATPEALCGMFDKSGIYEALGGGDAEVGKVRTMQVVHEMKRRGAQGSLVLSNKSVEQVVEDRVNEPGFGEGADWFFMANAKEQVRQGGVWGFRSKGEGKQETAEQKEAWGRVYGVYERYHSEFKPGSEGTREELSEDFDGFVDWYVDNKMKQAAKEYKEAARDWYAAKVYEGLMANVDVGADGKAGYGSYASDVAVMRDVLKQAPPRHLGAEERLRMLESKERDAERRSEAFRKQAADDYERLRGMKAEEKANGAQAKRAEAAAAAKEKKDAEKEQARLEAVEMRKRNVARAMPRQAEWVWDGSNGADGELPACTLPEAEYRRLVDDLGYDGTQVVYVQVAGARLQVTGANKRGRMMLNTAAVAKVQKKPNVKKGERWKYAGNLGYSYFFKNVSANN